MIRMNLQKGSVSRANYLRKNRIFGAMGERVRYQPHIIPLYPELIRLHNNITVAANVRLITHDASFAVLNWTGEKKKYPEKVGCIEIMDNVFIGYGTTILPNVRIGSNVIIGACSVVTKDLAPNGVYIGSPARRICSFDDYRRRMDALPEGGYAYPTVAHNTHISEKEVVCAWQYFFRERSEEENDEAETSMQ